MKTKQIIGIIVTGIVKRGIVTQRTIKQETFLSSFKEGWKAITTKQGIIVLIIVSGIMTCFMGTFQILAEPMVLDFTDSTTLGIMETICASGMLVSSLILGVKGLKKGYVKTLSVSLAFAGITMAMFGVKQNIYVMCVTGFLFFAMLPFANNCLDYLTRINIPDEKQGRAWGLIGFLSQLGYVVAYGLSGILADGISASMNISVGRGAAYAVIISGVLLCFTSIILSFLGSVKELERKD